MIRLLVPNAQEGALRVEGPRHHYLRHVLRVQAGTTLEVFDGAGRCFAARVTQLDEKGATLELGAPTNAPPASRAVTVLQGLPRADKLELVLQKGTELGASAFLAAPMARSVARLEGKADQKQQRWQRIAEEAARQCQRSDVPTVKVRESLLAAVDSLEAGTALLVLDEAERAVPLSAALASTPGALALVVGPEGGLTREEVELLVGRGAVCVTLGRRVLRTETAAFAALAVIRHLDGELG